MLTREADIHHACTVNLQLIFHQRVKKNIAKKLEELSVSETNLLCLFISSLQFILSPQNIN